LKHNVENCHLNIFIHLCTCRWIRFWTFHSLYFPNQKILIQIYDPWSLYAILHILNMSHFTKYPHPLQVVYINHKTKWYFHM
jgi:hypothetical protein